MTIASLAAGLFLLGAPAFSASPAAVVDDVSGQAEILLGGVEPWTPAVSGQALQARSQIRTRNGSVVVVFAGGSKVRVSPNSQFTLETADSSRFAVFLGLGKLQAWVKGLGGRSFQARTPTAVASVRGTVFGVAVGGDRRTTFDLFEGRLAVTDSFGRSNNITAGQRLDVTQRGADKPAPLPTGERLEPEPTTTYEPKDDGARTMDGTRIEQSQTKEEYAEKEAYSEGPYLEGERLNYDSPTNNQTVSPSKP